MAGVRDWKSEIWKYSGMMCEQEDHHAVLKADEGLGLGKVGGRGGQASAESENRHRQRSRFSVLTEIR